MSSFKCELVYVQTALLAAWEASHRGGGLASLLGICPVLSFGLFSGHGHPWGERRSRALLLEGGAGALEKCHFV